MSDTPETIYLIPDASEGVLGHVWCEDPAPGLDMDPADAIEYVRADAAKARIAELEEALEPFAREYYDLASLSTSEEKFFGRQDLRRAAELLKDNKP